METLKIPAKKYRAEVIKWYMKRWGFDKAVCFSCGNASKALIDVGVDTLDISPNGRFLPLSWFDIGEVRRVFPDYFDATSGHLPMDCMKLVAQNFKDKLGTVPSEFMLPTGSGETLLELKLAFPTAKITAVYNLNEATKFEQKAPLNDMVKILANDIVFWEGENADY